MACGSNTGRSSEEETKSNSPSFIFTARNFFPLYLSPFELALQCTASFLQISGEKLGDAVNELFCNDKILEERRTAAKHAYHALSRGVVENVWRQLQFHIFNKSMRGMNVVEQRT